MTATTLVAPPVRGTPPTPAIPIRRLTAAPMTAFRQVAEPTRVSQTRLGATACYWYPVGVAVAVGLPYHPLASRITLIVPTALKTHTEVVGPPVNAGPSSTITRFAWTAPARRFKVENGGAWVPVYVQPPFELVGNTLRNVPAVPATPVMLRTAAPAVPLLGIGAAPIAVTLTAIAVCPSTPCALHTGVGE